MKRILIVFGIIFLAIYGYGKYLDYKRYNTDVIEYKPSSKIDVNYYSKDVVTQYYKSIEALNSYVKLQWFSHKIDVLKPVRDNLETKEALEVYAKKMSAVKYYEEKLERSSTLKNNGLSSAEVKKIFETGKTTQFFESEKEKDLLRALFRNNKSASRKLNGSLVYEIQKILVQKGFEIPVDGIFKGATSEALKKFQKDNGLFETGELDVLTFEKLIIN